MLQQAIKRNIYPYLSLSWPILLPMLGFTCISMVDFRMITSLGGNNQKAAQLTGQLIGIFLTFAMGFASVLAPVVAQGTRNNNYKEASVALKHTLLTNIALNVVVGLALYFCAAQLLHYLNPDPKVSDLLNQGPKVSDLAAAYLPMLALSLAPNALSRTLQTYIDGLGRVRTTMVLSFFGAGLNSLLNYLFIFGKCGFPAMGLQGVAVATLVSRMVVSLMYLSYAWHLKQGNYITALPPAEEHTMTYGRLVSIALPSGLELALRIGYVWLMSQVMMAQVGQHDAAIPLFMVVGALQAFPLAINLAGSILMGRAATKENRLFRQYAVGTTGYILITFAALLAALLLPVTLSYAFRLFNTPDTVAGDVRSLIWPSALFLLCSALHMMGIGLLRGMRDTTVPFLLTVGMYLGVPLAYWLGKTRGYGAHGILFSMNLTMAILAVLLYLRFRYKLRVTSYEL